MCLLSNVLNLVTRLLSIVHFLFNVAGKRYSILSDFEKASCSAKIFFFKLFILEFMVYCIFKKSIKANFKIVRGQSLSMDNCPFKTQMINVFGIKPYLINTLI